MPPQKFKSPRDTCPVLSLHLIKQVVRCKWGQVFRVQVLITSNGTYTSGSFREVVQSVENVTKGAILGKFSGIYTS